MDFESEKRPLDGKKRMTARCLLSDNICRFLLFEMELMVMLFSKDGRGKNWDFVGVKILLRDFTCHCLA